MLFCNFDAKNVRDFLEPNEVVQVMLARSSEEDLLPCVLRAFVHVRMHLTRSMYLRRAHLSRLYVHLYVCTSYVRILWADVTPCRCTLFYS